MTNVDVGNIFRRFSIAEIEDIEKEVKGDVEQKKEDLRQMVGRRYRDIIEAADNIRNMKQMSENIMDSIIQVQVGFERLYLLQQQLATAQQRSHLVGRGRIDSLIIHDTQLKLLLELPELIWECLDEKSASGLLSGVWCLLLAEHVLHVLIIPLGSAEVTDTDMLIHLQSIRLKSIRSVVSERLCDNFQSSHLNEDIDSLTDHLCATALNDNLCAPEILRNFLDRQKRLLVQLFNNLGYVESGRDKICRCVSIFQQTIDTTGRLFLSAGGVNSAFLRSITQLVIHGWQPETFQQFVAEQSRFFKASLPSEVIHFKPKFKADLEELNPINLQHECVAWLQESLNIGIKGIGQTLDYFDSISSLASLKQSIITIIKNIPNARWCSSTLDVLGYEFSIFDTVVREQLTIRLKKVTEERLREIFESLQVDVNAIEVVIEETINDQVEANEFTNFESLSRNIATSLVLRARGVSGFVYKLIRKFDEELYDVVQSLENYLAVGEEDGTDILPVLSRLCLSILIEFLTNVKAEVQSEGMEKKLGNKVFIYGRVFLCMCELCSGLKSCLQMDTKYSSTENRSKEVERKDNWTIGCSALLDAAVTSYCVWADNLISSSIIDSGLMIVVNSLKTANKEWLAYAQEWEKIDIEEETISGNKVKSHVHVPLQLSRYACRLLESFLDRMIAESVHRLPKHVRIEVASKIWQAFLHIYEQLLTVEQSVLNQRLAIQLLFDIKVLALLLNAAAKNDTMKRLVSVLESCVDPFDLDVLGPHLRQNVANFVDRSTCLYGWFVSRDGSGRGTWTGKEGLDTTQLLPLCPDVNRFNLLPVASHTINRSSDAVTGVPSGHLTSVHSEQTFAVKSSSAASFSSFYGKLSSTWFGN